MRSVSHTVATGDLLLDIDLPSYPSTASHQMRQPVSAAVVGSHWCWVRC